MEKEDNLLDTIRKTIPPINEEGWKFIAIFALVTAVLGAFSSVLGTIGIILTVWCAYFFRDPVRMVPLREGLVVSPADGLVQKIVRMVPPASLKLGDKERVRVSIFLNVFDVHVNRIPVEGVISHLHYHPGAFFNASLDKASEENERQYVTVTMNDGVSIGVVQIAGLVARRILCQITEGQRMGRGERFGLIRFGSRVDIFLPEGVEPLVAVGQRAVGGETIIADLTSTEKQRSAIGV